MSASPTAFHSFWAKPAHSIKSMGITRLDVLMERLEFVEAEDERRQLMAARISALFK